MKPDEWRRISAIFHEALARDEAARSAYLDDTCGDDAALRREVEKLLRAHAEAGGFGEQPVSIDGPALASGAMLGSYRIERRIGAGGMGEVFQARDVKLGRDVAIKVLPPEFGSDPERLARLTREARVLASLNHPYIGAIYGLEDAGPVRGIVLELIEGPTLADLIAAGGDGSRGRAAGGALTINHALSYARQIAEALEAAHARGIVHRDLKPANIKVTPAGVVKVLDFGLAKAFGPDAAERGVAVTVTGTHDGVIAGTIAYMSPEQARGAPVDKQTDIWAFGCVLLEMLTQRPAFDGTTSSDVLARILERDPEWDRIPPTVPPSIVRLLKRCLQKDPARRLHDIADARLEIVEVLEAGGSQRTLPPAPVVARSRPLVVPLLILVAIAAAGVWLLLRTRGPESSGQPIEFSINLGDYTPGFGVEISPDGRHVAIGTASSGRNQIWVHAVDGSGSGPLPGSEFGVHPFWSPDGSSLAFFSFTTGTLVRTQSVGGPTTIVSEARLPAFGGSWSRDGVMIFSSRGQLLQVPATGGTPVPLATPGDEDAVRSRTFPQFLPDGRHFLYHSGQVMSSGAINVGSLDGAPVRHVLDSPHARYAAPGYLLFVRGTALMAQRFDAATLTLSGEPALVSPEGAAGYVNGLAAFSASANGMLTLVPTRAGNRGQLTWFDRTGRALRSIQAQGGAEYLNPAIAPTGDRVAVNRQDPQTGRWEVWMIEVERDSPTRVASGPFDALDPIWSPDGRALAFVKREGPQTSIIVKSLDTSAAEQRLFGTDDPLVNILPSDWTKDGQYFIYQQSAGRGVEVFAMPLTGERTPIRVTSNGYFNYGGHVSPDGRWIAYASNEAGPFELYVERFLAPGQKTKISRSTGIHPRWMKDGRELVYWTEPGGVIAVTLDFKGDGFRISEPQPLITARILVLMDGRTHYDAAPDGQRFLLRQPAGSTGSSVSVIANWTARLNGR